MKTLFHDSIQFFKKEKWYAILFLIVVLVSTFFLFTPGSKISEPNSSPALDRFSQAEAKIEKQIQEAGSLNNFLRERPHLDFLSRIGSFLIAGAFTLGLLFNLFWIFSPPWRKSLSVPAPPVHTPWKVSMIFKVALLFLAGTFASSFLFGLIHRFLLPNVSINFFILLHTTIMDLLCLVFILFIIREAGGDWKDLGLRIPKGKGFKEVLIGLGAYLSVLPLFGLVLILLLFLANLFHYEPPAHPLVKVFLEEEERSPWIIGYSVVLATLFGPLLEEIFFRGFCYSILRKRYGVKPAMIATAAFFALIHENTFAFWPIFILGMALAYVYEKRKTLIAPVTLHLIHNAIFIGYFFLAKSVVMQTSGS